MYCAHFNDLTSPMDALPAAGRPTVPGNPFGGVEKPSAGPTPEHLRTEGVGVPPCVAVRPLARHSPFVCFPMGRRFVGR